ncbi:MAG: hypothetical protein JKY89_07770 [Immundisolibacteraceae bacterium]|nr:hypothetical protein [Immundisolibacteraceae bacterium]
MGLSDRRFVFLDIESTGGSIAEDRITEIGLLTVDDGEVTREWSSLINPQRNIPSFIAGYIGITDEMVADAPKFGDIAESLQEMLKGRILVAHNARFDYSFLRHEFRLVDRFYHSEVLCTVKLSRRLFPHFKKHNLDTLIARHKLPCEARHRAFGDAKVLWDFIQLAATEQDELQVDKEISGLVQPLDVPPGLSVDAFDDLPETAGVYLFWDQQDAALLVGKAKNIRAKVLAQLAAGSGNRRVTELREAVGKVEWLETVGIVGAELEEGRLVDELRPPMNSSPAVSNTETSQLVTDDQGRLQIQFVPAEHIAEQQPCYGLFRNRDDARKSIQAAVNKQPFCTVNSGFDGLVCPVHGTEQRLDKDSELQTDAGIETSSEICPSSDDIELSNTQLEMALIRLKQPDWPFAGPAALTEQQSWPERKRVHLFDCWQYLGFVEQPEAVFEKLEQASSAEFDLGIYRLLKRLLEVPKTAAGFIPVNVQGEQP